MVYGVCVGVCVVGVLFAVPRESASLCVVSCNKGLVFLLNNFNSTG